MNEMFPRPTDYLQPPKSAWLERAKQLATTGEKKVEPFNFRPESCVKSNDVEAARKLPDNMYDQMQVDKIADVLAASPPVPEKVRPRFLFTVEIVVAEGLIAPDSSPSALLDTFVTLSDEAGNRLVKTRTIYETLSPRCRILLRISMKGEKDDVQLYFGRAFRSLKRSEGDMMRIFVDKMSPFI